MLERGGVVSSRSSVWEQARQLCGALVRGDKGGNAHLESRLAVGFLRWAS